MISIRTVNIFLDMFSIILLITILIGCYFDRKQAKEKRSHYFEGILFFAIIRALADGISWILEGQEKYAGLAFFVTLMLTLSAYMMTFMFTHYLFYNLYKEREKKMLRWVDVGFYVMMILAVVCSCTGKYFSIVEGYYVRGSWFVYTYIYPTLIMAINIGIILLKKEINIRERACYFLYAVFPIVGDILQIKYYGFSTAIIFNTINIHIIYINIYLEKSKEVTRKNEELAENRISMMLSQIQPHFLYNALNTIYYLCKSDSEKAAEVVAKFSDYLRGNMDSITKKTTIPFKQELQHVENYLSIERVRFPEIKFIYNIEVTDFLLPALTLQPLVENAIRYGASKREDEMGKVVISTWEDENHYYMQVEDNGTGFDPRETQADGRSHIGITNTEARLEKMCKGSLKIESIKGESTTVTVCIPKVV